MKRISDAERQQQFNQQLRNDALGDVAKFLSEPQYKDVRVQYSIHFDKILQAVNNPRTTLRTCVEDIAYLNPIISSAIESDSLFFKEIHRAIKDGMLTKDILLQSCGK